MKKVLLLLTFYIIALSSFSQKEEEKSNDCFSVSLRQSKLINELLAEKKYDDAFSEAKTLYQYCPLEPYNLLILSAMELLQTGKLGPNAGSKLLQQLLDQTGGIDERDNNNYYRENDYSVPKTTLFTIGEKLQDKEFPEGSKEALFVQFLFNDRFETIKELKKNKETLGDWKKSYDTRVRSFYKKSMGFFAIRSGLWLPQLSLDSIPELINFGMAGGGSFRNGDVLAAEMDFRIISNTLGIVPINTGDTLLTSQQISGFSFNVTYDKQILFSRNSRHRIGLKGGFGYDLLDITPDDYRGSRGNNNNNNNNNSGFDNQNREFRDIRFRLHSIAASVGLSYQYHFTSSAFVGIDARFILNNYRNPYGERVTGSAYLGNFTIGWRIADGNILESQKLGRSQF